MSKPGLGAAHRKLRKMLPKPCGEPCPFCGKPMWSSQRLQLDHVVPRVDGGAAGPVRWAHGSCNEAAGARLAASRRFGKVRSREW